LADTTTLVVAVEEPGNPAVTPKVWPQANYYEVLAKNQIMSLVFEENCCLREGTFSVSVAGSSGNSATHGFALGEIFLV